MNGVEHGGPDASHPVRYDFSTNANPLGPSPFVVDALQRADRSRYPDPDYVALRERLGAWHGVDPARVLPAAGTSEAIRRLTLAVHLHGLRAVWVPRPGYADYAFAARALDLVVHEYTDAKALMGGLAKADKATTLVWMCEPNSPTGQTLPASCWPALQHAASVSDSVIALDRAYQPMRLRGIDEVPIGWVEHAWQCFSPNKALGTTGVRAGYLVAPQRHEQSPIDHVLRLSPSWVLSAEGVALLGAWVDPAVQSWLRECLRTLRGWARSQREALDALGWTQQPSVTPYWLVRPTEQGGALAQRLSRLREQGIKLRDATSLGCPGWLRLSVQSPEAQHALVDAWRRAGSDTA